MAYIKTADAGHMKPHWKPKRMKQTREGEKKTTEVEEKVVKILTHEKLSAIKAMLEKDHAIDCMFLLMINRGQWKYAREFTRKLGQTLPDGTFRARMIEIEECGLATHEKIDAKKRRWIITKSGFQLGRLLFSLFAKLDCGGLE